MKRTDITALFPSATEEQIKTLMDLNGADINGAKRGVDDLTAQLTTAQSTITELEKNKGDTAALQKQLDDYKAAEDKRKADETAAAAAAAIEARFNAALGDKKFASDYTRKGVLADFTARLADEANKGKGDAEIFKAITENDKGVLPGLFASANPPAGNMGGVGGTGGDDQTTARDEIKKQLFGGN